jgi:phosphomannomutase
MLYAGREVQVRIEDLSIIAVQFPPRAMGLVIEWAAQRRAALREDWRRARAHEPLRPIAPLT